MMDTHTLLNKQMVSLPMMQRDYTKTNLQKPEKAVAGDADGYTPIEIVDIFATIQGEGPFTGDRAVFLRLAGCNLQCPACDTDYTTNRRSHTAPEIVELIKNCIEVSGMLWKKDISSTRDTNNNPLIVITGGEPLRQSHALMVDLLPLLLPSFRVQLETNGTYMNSQFEKMYNTLSEKMDQYDLDTNNESSCTTPLLWSFANLSIVVSPKTHSLPPEAFALANALKYVLDIHHVDQYDGLPTSILGKEDIRPARPMTKYASSNNVYVQPEDNSHIHANMGACVHSSMKFGYVCGTQAHKLWGVK